MTSEDASTRLKTVAVVGLGFVGRGIATCLLGHGFRVIGCERSPKSQGLARSYIEQGLRELVERAGFDPELLENWSDRYHETDQFDHWTDCDFVIESVVEEASEKQDVFDKIECIVGQSVPIASNTSAIPITTLQNSRKYPERFIGMHWFEPAYVTRFMELIPGEYTSQVTINAAVTLACRCGKDPSVLLKDIPGFIVNRLLYAVYREALHLLELEVADAETIDRTFRNVCGVWATVCGPLQWIDLTGGPGLYAKCMKRVVPTLSNATEVPEFIVRLAEEGAQGVTNGHGFYDYTPEQAKRAEAIFHLHAWRARALMDDYFPLKEK